MLTVLPGDRTRKWERQLEAALTTARNQGYSVREHGAHMYAVSHPDHNNGDIVVVERRPDQKLYTKSIGQLKRIGVVFDRNKEGHSVPTIQSMARIEHVSPEAALPNADALTQLHDRARRVWRLAAKEAQLNAAPQQTLLGTEYFIVDSPVSNWVMRCESKIAMQDLTVLLDFLDRFGNLRDIQNTSKSAARIEYSTEPDTDDRALDASMLEAPTPPKPKEISEEMTSTPQETASQETPVAFKVQAQFMCDRKLPGTDDPCEFGVENADQLGAHKRWHFREERRIEAQKNGTPLRAGAFDHITVDPATGRFHCPLCPETMANKTGLLGHGRNRHGLPSKSESSRMGVRDATAAAEADRALEASRQGGLITLTAPQVEAAPTPAMNNGKAASNLSSSTGKLEKASPVPAAVLATVHDIAGGKLEESNAKSAPDLAKSNGKAPEEVEVLIEMMRETMVELLARNSSSQTDLEKIADLQAQVEFLKVSARKAEETEEALRAEVARLSEVEDKCVDVLKNNSPGQAYGQLIALFDVV